MKTHISSKINGNKNKSRNLYKILKSLTKVKDENPMPPTESLHNLPNKCPVVGPVVKLMILDPCFSLTVML